MDLNSKLPRTEVVVAVVRTTTEAVQEGMRRTGVFNATDRAALEELGRVLAWCLLRDATNQTPPPTSK